MNEEKYKQNQRLPEKRGDMIWYPDALSFIESYGVDPAIIEAAALHPWTVTDDPKGAEVGYPVKRLRRGDVEVVVGYRDEDEPAILYVRLHTPDDPTSGGRGSIKPQGRGSKIPTTLRGLKAEILQAGYSIELGGRHDLVRRPDGSVCMTLPITPSSPTSIPNAYQNFLRVLQTDRTKTALAELAAEVETNKE